MRILSALIGALFLSFSLSAQMNQVEFTEFDLDNGLHVILHQDNATPIVVVGVMYHVGSKNEKPGKSGFAHFFEHLLFEGSENIERGEFDKHITNNGGANNAFTSQDKTYYYDLLPSNHLETGLWLESERMLHAKVEDIGIETQREVVKEERRLRIDNQPYGTFLEVALRNTYSEHPYKSTVIGTMEDLNAAEESDYVNFYKDFYTPNNAVLTIAGDIDIAAAKKLVNKYFATIPVKTADADIYRPSSKMAPVTGTQVDTVYDNIQLPAVIQTFRIPAMGTPDYYAVDMLTTLLAGGRSSRMFKSIVDDQQLALQVGNFAFDNEHPGMAVAFAICNQDADPSTVKDAIDKEIMKAQNDLISEEEFQKLKNQKESSFIQSNAKIEGIAQSLANYHMFYGDASLINNELDRYLAVTREDIQRVAKQYFSTKNRSLITYLPKKETP